MYYDEDYYEKGLETGKSCYQNYRWVPELTIPLAMTLIDGLGITRSQKILDYGCAKGYLVKAFRLLYRQAYGVDISDYALSHADEEIRGFCGKPVDGFLSRKYDWVIAKDVFEHIPEETLKGVLQELPSDNLFVCVPLGLNGKYIAPANNFDQSHIICENEMWWLDFFASCNWSFKSFSFRIDGIKDHYYEKFPNAHGFFNLCRPLKR